MHDGSTRRTVGTVAAAPPPHSRHGATAPATADAAARRAAPRERARPDQYRQAAAISSKRGPGSACAPPNPRPQKAVAARPRVRWEAPAHDPLLRF